MHPAHDDVMDWESDAVSPAYNWPPFDYRYLNIPPQHFLSHFTPTTSYTQFGPYPPWFMPPRQATRVLIEENARVRAELETLKGKSLIDNETTRTLVFVAPLISPLLRSSNRQEGRRYPHASQSQRSLRHYGRACPEEDSSGGKERREEWLESPSRGWH